MVAIATTKTTTPAIPAKTDKLMPRPMETSLPVLLAAAFLGRLRDGFHCERASRGLKFITFNLH